MMKRIFRCLLAYAVAAMMLFCSGIVSLGSDEYDGTVIFRYTEADSNEFIPDGTDLEKDKEYDLHIYLKDVKAVNSIALPIHFDPDVVKIVSFTTGETVKNGYFDLLNDLYGESGVFLVEDFIFNVWYGIPVTNGVLPYVENDKGLVSILYVDNTQPSRGISGEHLMLKIRFKTVGFGLVDFRDAKSSIDDFYEGTAPNGFLFAVKKAGGGSEELNIKSEIDLNKKVAVKPQGINISQSSIKIGATEMIKLDAEVLPEGADQSVIWESEDENIATVSDDGTVTGVNPGNTTITAYTKDKKFSDKCAVEVIDRAIPSVPANLKAEIVTGSCAGFSWDESTGYYGVDGYIIYRDGEEIGRVEADEELYFEDEGLTEGNTYKYTVAAYYGTAVSEQSAALNITPKGVKIDSVVPGNYSTIGGDGTTKFTVYYNNTHNADGAEITLSYGKNSAELSEYEIENAKSGVSGSLNWFSFNFDMSEISESGEYVFNFKVTDMDGFYDEYTANYEVDVIPPSKLTNFSATGQEKYVMLSWDKSTEANVEKYLVYRSDAEDGDYSLIATIENRDKVTYKDTDVVEETTYYYYVVAEDAFGQKSEESDIKSASAKADTTAPEVYSIRISPRDDVINGIVTVDFTVYDEVKLDKIVFEYSIEEGVWEKIEEKTLTSDKASFSFDTTKYDDGQIQLRGVVYDAAGNSSNGEPVRTCVIDNTGPSKPQNLSASNVLSTSLHLSWKDVSDEDREYYIVEYKKAGSDDKLTQYNGQIKALGVNITSLEQATEYEFYVTAYDKYGNRGTTSDAFYVTTEGDTNKPVITAITPSYQNVKGDFSVTFTATDDCGVDYADIQISFDGEQWEKIDTVDITSNGTKVNFSYTLKTDSYNEGLISIRAIPVDINSNRGDDSSAALSNSYYIDRTPVDVPLNVTANVCTDADAIEVRWDVTDFDKEENKDFKCYIVYRSESEDGVYTVVNPDCTNINYIDYDVQFNKTYYYKVKTSDKCGNLSEFSNTASCMLTDTEPPYFYSIYPKNNGYIGTDMKITATVKDNNKLSYVELWYLSSESGWKLIDRKDTSLSSIEAVFNLNESIFTEDIYKFKITADDSTGVHKIESAEITYTIDKTAPVISDLKATPGVENVTLSWNCQNTSGLKGYYVYHRTESGYYYSSPVATVSPDENSAVISGLDPKKKYVFKLVATDFAENTSELESDAVSPLAGDPVGDTTPPVISMNVPSVFTVGIEGSFDASGCYDNDEIKSYLWEFGDGSTSSYKTPVHAYEEVGEYEVKLTVTDKSGNYSVGKKTIKVKEKKNVAIVNITVIDDHGNRVPGANVVFDYSTENASKYVSDSSGRVQVETETGTYSVGVYKDGYLPAEKKVTAQSNDTTELTIRIIEKNIVIGTLKWERMTLEDIIEAGIDTSDPENQNIYRFEVSIVIGEEEVVVKGHKAVNDLSDNFTPIEFETNIPVGSGGKNINQKFYIFDFNDKDNYSYDSDHGGIEAEQPKTFVASISTPGEVSWLKEFFDVELSVSNQADEQFVIEDCEVWLNYNDDGLTLMTDLTDSASSAGVEIGDLCGQQTKTVNWVLRGDVEGEYPISTDFYGELKDFYTTINATFECENPIKVYGDSGMSIIIEAENDVNPYDDYAFRLGLRNESPIEKYLPNAEVTETDNIKAVKNYQNYVEVKGEILRTEPDTLYSGETLYSDYVIKGLDVESLTIENMQKMLDETFGIAYNGLPVYYKLRPQYSFAKSLLKIYDGADELPSTLKLYRNEEKHVTANITKLIPSDNQYAPLEGEKVYMKLEGGEYILAGTTDENGNIDISFKIPSDYEGENYRVSLRGNRTGEKYIDVFVLGEENKTDIEGVVTDQYGNPVVNAVIDVGGDKTKTDYEGKYRFEQIEHGDKNIRITKEGYETVEMSFNVVAGYLIKNLRMKKIPKERPKILSVSSDIASDATDEIIVPLGYDREYVLDVNAKPVGSAKIDKYIIELTKPDGSTEIIGETNGKKVSCNFRDMSVGDTLSVYVKDDNGIESAHLDIPVKVVETPFVNILNIKKSEKATERLINECYSYKMRVSNLFKNFVTTDSTEKQWLTGEFKDNWDALFDKFKVNMTLNVAEDNEEVKSETEFDIAWFDYIGYNVTVKYDFSNGDLKIFPGYVTARGREIYETGSNNRFSIEETIRQDIERASSDKYKWLKAWNKLTWQVDGGFNVEFNLDSNAESDTWKGSFNLWSEDSKDFYGTYYRKKSKYEYTYNTPGSEYLEGVWYKNLEVHQDEVLDLTAEGIENSQFVMDYNTYTQGSWRKGISHMTLTSQSINQIYLLPEARIKGTTSLAGDYYVLGYRYPLYDSAYTTKTYDKTFDKNTFSLMSAQPLMGSALAEIKTAELMPITKSANPQASGEDGVIANNIFANTQNALVNADNTVLVYLNNNESRAEGEQSQLMYRSYENGSWSQENAVVAGDNTADYTPYIADTPYGIMSAWADSSGNIYENQGMTMEEISKNIASQLSISLSVYNDGVWSDTVKINENNYLDYAPVIASQKKTDDDKNPLVMVSWISNESNNMTDSNRKDEIMYSIYDGEKWSAPESVLGGSFGAVSDLKIKEHNGVFYILFAMQTVNDADTPDDTSDDTIGETKLYTAMYSNKNWSVHRTLNAREASDGFGDFMVDNDELQVVYTHASYINRVNAVTKEIIEDRTENSLINTASEMISVQDEDVTALAWISNPENTQKIYVNTFADGKWSENVEIASAKENEVIGNLKAFAENGEIVVVYDKYIYDTVNNEYTLTDVRLCSESIAMTSEVDVLSVEADEKAVMKNKDVHFAVTVKNNGMKDINSYKVRLSSNHMPEAVEVSVSDVIKGGETKIINVDWTAGTITDSFDVTASAITEGNESEVKAFCTLTPYDTEVSEVSFEETGDELKAVVKLENHGYIDIGSYKVLVKKTDGTVIKTVDSEEALVHDGSKVIEIDLTSHIAELSEANTRIEFNISTGLIEFNEDNNSMFKNIQTDNIAHSAWSGNVDFYGAAAKSENSYLNESYLNGTQVEVAVTKDEAASVEVDLNNAFKVNAPSNAEYTVTFNKRGILPRVFESVEFNAEDSVADGVVELIPGDVVQNEKNCIDVLDMAHCIYYLDKTNIEKDILDYMDYNCDGVIQLEELNAIISNYGRTSKSYDALDSSN